MSTTKHYKVTQGNRSEYCYRWNQHGRRTGHSVRFIYECTAAPATEEDSNSDAAHYAIMAENVITLIAGIRFQLFYDNNSGSPALPMKIATKLDMVDTQMTDGVRNATRVAFGENHPTVRIWRTTDSDRLEQTECINPLGDDLGEDVNFLLDSDGRLHILLNPGYCGEFEY